MSPLSGVPVAQPSSPRSKAGLHLSVLFLHPPGYVSFLRSPRRRNELRVVAVMSPSRPGRGRVTRLQQRGPGPLHGRTALACSPHHWEGWGVTSSWMFLTDKGNEIRSSLTPVCQQTLRGEPLHAAHACCCTGAHELCLIHDTYSPGLPKMCPPRISSLPSEVGRQK